MQQPKGFRNYGQVTPVKQGGKYTAGTFNGQLSNTTNKPYSAWLLYQTSPMTSTGKNITIDVAVFRQTHYFDLTAPWIKIYIRFYSMISRTFDGHWTQIGNTYPLSYLSSGVYEESRKAWDSPSHFGGSHKPAYGAVNTDLLSQAISNGWNYATYWNAYAATGKSFPYWDSSSPNYRSLCGVMPFGLRYISNNGKWSPSSTEVNPNGVISRNYQTTSSFNWSQSNEDGGNSPGQMKNIVIDKGMIERIHGTATGVTAFQLKIDMGSGGNDVYTSWLFGSYNAGNPAEGQGIFTMIDNPLIGLLDYGAAGAAADWPPRFDAKAYDINAGNKELQAQYCAPGGSWGIF